MTGKRKKTNRFNLILIPLILLLPIVFFLIRNSFFSDSDEKVNKHLLSRGTQRDFNIEVNVVGVLDAEKSHMISSDLDGLSGTIIYLIGDGERVKKGDVLVQFNRTPFEKEVAKYAAQVESYTAAVQAAEQVVAFETNQVEREIANAEYGQSVAVLELKRLREGDGPLELSRLEEEQQAVQIKLQRYQSFFADLEKLQQKGFDNPSEISSTKEQIAAHKEKLAAITKRYHSYKNHVLPALIESGKAKVENASLVLQQTIQGGKYRVAKARAGVLQVKATLKSQKTALDKARFELAKTEIRAPLDGIVIHYTTFRNGQKRKPREGDAVFVNQPILYLPDVSRMIIKTKVREVDLDKIELGQQARVIVDAYPDAELTGRLTFIGALATSEESDKSREKYFQVLFRINEEDDRLRPGMTCRAFIQAESVRNALTVPVQAVFSENQFDICYVRTREGGFEKRVITTGRQNDTFVEITGGIQEGEEVSLVRQMTE